MKVPGSITSGLNTLIYNVEAFYRGISVQLERPFSTKVCECFPYIKSNLLTCCSIEPIKPDISPDLLYTLCRGFRIPQSTICHGTLSPKVDAQYFLCLEEVGTLEMTTFLGPLQGNGKMFSQSKMHQSFQRFLFLGLRRI